MLIIGLTGNIGSGKSTVADQFARLGVPVIDADVIARQATEPDTPAFQAIIDRFGRDILTADGQINRRLLRDIVFNQPEERTWLEQLLHPAIIQQMKVMIAGLDTPYCIAVIPLLFESGNLTFINRTLVVDISPEAQLERTILRDNSTEKQIKAILKTQMPREQQLSKADDVIDNSGSQNKLAAQVEKLHQKYLQLSRQ